MPHLSPHDLKVVETRQNQTDHTAWILESVSKSRQTFVAYDSEIELHHHHNAWRFVFLKITRGRNLKAQNTTPLTQI